MVTVLALVPPAKVPVAPPAALVKVPAVPDTSTELPVVVPLPVPAVVAVIVAPVTVVTALAYVFAALLATLYLPVLGEVKLIASTRLVSSVAKAPPPVAPTISFVVAPAPVPREVTKV